jgi:hypothetical protein
MRNWKLNSGVTIAFLFIYFLILLVFLAISHFNKCDMSKNLLPLMKYTLLQFNAKHIPVWLEDGTLLAAIRDNQLLSWEFDIDLSVNEEYCDSILNLRKQFKRERNYNIFGRQEFIPEKQNLLLGYSGYLSKPCARIYDENMQYYVDVDWHIRIPAAKVEKHPTKLYLPQGYHPESGDSLICNFDGFDSQEAGGCRVESAMFPLRSLSFYGIPVQVPQKPELVLEMLYGTDWRVPKTKGYKFVCRVLPTTTILNLIFLISFLVAAVVLGQFRFSLYTIIPKTNESLV